MQSRRDKTKIFKVLKGKKKKKKLEFGSQRNHSLKGEIKTYSDQQKQKESVVSRSCKNVRIYPERRKMIQVRNLYVHKGHKKH